MNCDDLLRQLTENTEGTLDADLCELIDRHLRECTPCAGLENDLEDLRRLCRQGADRPQLPDALRARLSALLEE